MGCCGETPPHEEHAKQPGIREDRHCTDCFFLILFILFWVGMIAVAIAGGSKGDPYRLVYGWDYEGNVCGRDNIAFGRVPANYSKNMKDKPYVYFLFYYDINSLSNTLMGRKPICVSECPNATHIFPTNANEIICPYNVSQSNFPSNLYIPFSVPSELSTILNFTGISLCNNTNDCCVGTLSSTPLLNRCLPISESLYNATKGLAGNVTAEINNRINTDGAQKILSDVGKSWKWILTSAFIALALAFVWLFLLRIFSALLVWLTIFGVVAVMIALTYVARKEWVNEQTAYNALPTDQQISSKQNNITGLKVLFWIMFALDIILILVIIAMINRIRLAIGIIKESSKAMATMPSIVFFPIVIFVMLALLCAYWIGVALYLGTAGDPTYQNGTFIGYKSASSIRYMQWYHLFGLFWTSQFIIAIGHATVAGAVASWYWVHDKKDVPLFPVWTSFTRTVRYHLGSLAFGSFILAVVQTIRALLKYLDHQLKVNNKEAQWAQYALRVLDCCLACFERFLKFLNKNAYIMISIYGYSFCEGARRGFELILENILRVSAVTIVGNFLMFLGKLFICFSTSLAAFYIIRHDKSIEFWVIPVFIVGVLSYAIGSAFMSVYDMAIDTLLLCFCEDCKRHDGSPENPYYMSASLKHFVDNHEDHIWCKSCCGGGGAAAAAPNKGPV